MRNVISAAAVAGFGLCGTNLVSDSAAVARPVPVLLVFTQPRVARLDQSALLTVRGVRLVRQIRVRLRGSTTAIGLLAPWLPLRFHAGEWTARLPPLEHRGVYPIELRREPGGRILQSKRWLFRVLARGTLARPAFTSPIEVVRWWVQVVRHGTLVAIKPWRFSAHDHRDRRLHRKLVVAYSPPGDPSGRLGIFITCVRVDFGSKWRLLEATVAP